MIKVILAGLLLTGSVFANNTDENYKTTEAVFRIMKKNLPMVYSIYNDYFTAKTCSKDFARNVSIKEIREFSTTELYGRLLMLKNSNKTASKALYNSLISSYEFMNCENMEKLSSFIYSVSVLSNGYGNRVKKNTKD